jgi:hypothetical protein
MGKILKTPKHIFILIFLVSTTEWTLAVLIGKTSMNSHGGLVHSENCFAMLSLQTDGDHQFIQIVYYSCASSVLLLKMFSRAQCRCRISEFAAQGLTSNCMYSI